jgi:hypothetical protein
MVMMSQNIPMKQYLNSKAVLMSVSVDFGGFKHPYLYFGWKT